MSTKSELTISVTISGPLSECVQSCLSKAEISAENLGEILLTALANLSTRRPSEEPAKNPRKGRPMPVADAPSPGGLMQYGREITVTESTPLTVGSLCEFLGYSRSRIYGDIGRGYQLEFGDRTSASHYLAWLRKNPKQRKSSEGRKKIQQELARLT